MLCAFDFDGTIVNSKPAYYKAIQQYADKYNLPYPTPNEINNMFGNPELKVFDGWGTDINEFKIKLHAIYDLMDDIACKELALTNPYEGMASLLTTLENYNIKLAIVTSRALLPTVKILKHHDLHKFFCSFRTLSDVTERKYRAKPYPDKLICLINELKIPIDKVIMIGDTVMDIEMAKACNVYSIGVTWGFSTGQKLQDKGADKVIHKVDELQKHILTLI
jgi:phosphoglycolate phosphatase